MTKYGALAYRARPRLSSCGRAHRLESGGTRVVENLQFSQGNVLIADAHVDVQFSTANFDVEQNRPSKTGPKAPQGLYPQLRHEQVAGSSQT